MHFIDLARKQILPNCGNSPDSNFLVTCFSFCFNESGLDPVGDEVEGRAALHFEAWARIMRQHKNGSMEGRISAPPSFPALSDLLPVFGPVIS